MRSRGDPDKISQDTTSASQATVRRYPGVVKILTRLSPRGLAASRFNDNLEFHPARFRISTQFGYN